MTKWAWFAGAVLLAVAALAVFLAFRNPAFVAALGSMAAAALAKGIIAQVGKPLPPDVMAEVQNDFRAGHGDDYWRKRSGAPPKG